MATPQTARLNAFKGTDPDLEEVSASMIYKKISAGNEPNAGKLKIESAWALAVSCAVAASLRVSLELHLVACITVALAPCASDAICYVGVTIAGVLFYRGELDTCTGGLQDNSSDLGNLAIRIECSFP